MNVLVMNVGSSSLKASLWHDEEPVWKVNQKLGEKPNVPEDRIDVIGHRIVHGGQSFREPVIIDKNVLAEIRRLAEFAPEHNRTEADIIDQMWHFNVPQIAVFDTAFHATIPPEAYVYGGPHEWLDQGIRRYGFHGISHQYVSRKAAETLRRPIGELKLVSCHLGNGCSLTAIRNGQSVDTTMGFTPLEGLVMGTRSGSVDPGILIYLLRRCDVNQLDRTLNKESGLKGISGLSGDMREIEAAMDQGNERAKLAFDVFIHRLCREIGAMTASAGGHDALIFTGGIGENSQRVRDAVTARMSFPRVLVIPTDEEREIARQCRLTMNQGA